MAANMSILRRPLAPTGIWAWMTTVDHKRIGILYGVTAFFFFMLGGMEALIMRAQLASAESTLVSAATFNALFTMHGTTMVFMVVMPSGAAFFNFLVPLMIGARDVAFPRLNAFSYWLFLFGALLMNFSFFMNAFPDMGWFGYAPLTSNEFTISNSTDYWVLGLLVMGIGTTAAGFNFVVTILNMRAPGMTLMRMPVFVWMTLIVAFLIIFAFPPLTIALTFLLFDRFFDTNFFVDIGAGSDPLLWQHLFWIFGHPEVYILILPAMGIVSDVLPTFTRKPLFGYTMVVFAGVVIGFLGFGVWVHHMFVTGLGPWANAAFAATTMAIAVPTGVKIFNWLATLYGGSIIFKTPMLFALGFLSMFMLGGLSGVMHAVTAVDSQQSDTYFIVAHFHYVLFGGAIFGLTSGIYYWFPKISGKMLSEPIGKLHFWLMFIGFNLTFMPMHILGVIGMPRRIYTYAEDMGFEPLNQIVSGGSLIIALAIVVFTFNIARSVRQGEPAGDNPWGAPTLEWSIPSPPHHYNFPVIPTVRSQYPLWDENANVVLPPALPAHNEPIMPDPSYWPIMLAFAITMVAGGLIIWQGHAIAGLTVISSMGLLGMRSIFGWVLEPMEDEAHVSAHH
jgi:cytochrome c oxidase subunit 1